MFGTLIFIVLYTLLHIILLPIIIAILGITHIRRCLTDSVIERLGWLPRAPHNRHTLWLHAVSVGEVLALQEIVATIKREQPTAWIHLTVGTPSGKAIAKKTIAADVISYMPYDLVPCILLAHLRIRPQAIIVMEAELWPALFCIAKLRSIPLFLLNARISKRSAKRIMRLAFLIRPLLNYCTHILAQSEADHVAFLKLGISPSIISTLGNIKAFNVYNKLKHMPQPDNHPAYPIFLAGSIHPTEDAICLEAFIALKKQFPDVRCILVPRHFHWQKDLEQHVAATGYTYTVWTKTTQETDPITALNTHDILIVCRLGELFALYQHATFFVLGGTFVPVEGHNLLEPAGWGVPSIVGPRHANCRDIFAKLSAVNGAYAAQNSTDIIGIAEGLLANPEKLAMAQGANNIWIKKEAHHVENVMRSILFRSLFRS
jgi:3-deoxy-D-manno-octulosonic-acid transferase